MESNWEGVAKMMAQIADRNFGNFPQENENNFKDLDRYKIPSKILPYFRFAKQQLTNLKIEMN